MLLTNVLIGFVLYLISPYLLFLIPLNVSLSLSVIAPFVDVPVMVKSGKLTYHSLYFLAEVEKSDVIKIHGGTLFDYYFSLPRNSNEQERKSIIILEQLRGLMCLVKEKPDKLVVEGTSYFLNRRTAEKLGFEVVETDFVQKVILIFNYVNLMCSQYLVKGAIVFPSISGTKTFRAKVSEIRKRVGYIERLIKKLENR